MRRTPLHRLVLPVAALALTQTAAVAQSNSRDNLTGAWALTNARIETVTKGTIERGTVVIRDGVIEAVGASVNPPADAHGQFGKTARSSSTSHRRSACLPWQGAAANGGQHRLHSFDAGRCHHRCGGWTGTRQRRR
jgi:hypothetical protein